METTAFVAVATVSAAAYSLGGSLFLPSLIAFGFALAMIDTAFGMGYGTLATPVLLVVGLSPVAIVPAVLLSQALAAGLGTVMHVRYKNVNLLDLKGIDAKISAAVIAFGVLGVTVAVFLAINLPSLYVKTYIGLLVVSMGLLLMARPRFGFSWPKVYAVSIVNGFDKAISGGGFGPVAVGGLLTFGHRIRNSVGIAVFTVTVINFAGVAFYFLLNAVGSSELRLMAALSLGAVIGALVGPGITSRLDGRRHVNGLAGVIVLVGVLALLSTFVAL
jgi:uncharacterized protein